jgi:cyclopropane-fatty-acyl-phospholipid synthase
VFLETKLEKLAAGLKAEHNIPLTLALWNGQEFRLGDETKVTVRVPKASALTYFVSPDMAKLGEAFVEGHIEVDGNLRDIFEVGEKLAASAQPAAAGPSPLQGLKRLVTHSKQRDKRAIEYHYDVSNEFYRLFLDERMVYSCAYFKRPEDSLEQAQLQKIDHILNKLMLKPGERLLDIGCGWGALIVRAAQKYGAIATGVTLSQNQYDYARDLIKREGLGDRCEVRLQDYRDIPGEGIYDKIASVGMFEHVGLKNLAAYFTRIRTLLADNGLVLNHGITSVDPESRSVGLGAGEFIDRYVFPDGELPHISLVLREMEAAGLESTDVESLRRHYAKTCGIWADGLERNRARAIELAGARRYRIWAIYLAGCAHAFNVNWINIYQVLAAKRSLPGLNPLPLTRDYMYRGPA